MRTESLSGNPAIHNEGVIRSVADHAESVQAYNVMIKALGRGVYGEESAKDAVINGLVQRKGTALVGIPADAKSTLSEAACNMIYLPNREQAIALVAGQPNMTDKRIVGGIIPLEKHISEGDSERFERTLNRITGILTKNTVVLRLEEPTRLMPEVTNVLLPVLENRAIENTEGKVIYLPKLQGMILSFNPGERGEATNRFTTALSTRVPIGAQMGMWEFSDDEDFQDAMLQGIQELTDEAEERGFEKTSDLVPAVIAPEAFADMYNVSRKTAVSVDMEKFMRSVAIKTSKKLRTEFGHLEASPRIHRGIRTSSKVLGNLTNNENIVNLSNVYTATRQLINARVGTTQRKVSEDIDTIVKDLVK